MFSALNLFHHSPTLVRCKAYRIPAAGIFTDVENFLEGDYNNSSRKGYAREKFPQLGTFKTKLSADQKTVSKNYFGVSYISATVSARRAQLKPIFDPVDIMVKSQPADEEEECDHRKVESRAQCGLQLQSTSGERQLRGSRGTKVKPEPVEYSVKLEPQVEAIDTEARPQRRSARIRVKQEPAKLSVKQEAQSEGIDIQARPQRRKTNVRADVKSESEALGNLVKEEPKTRGRRKLDQVVGNGFFETDIKKNKRSGDLDLSPSAEASAALVLVDATNVTPPADEAELPVETSLVSLNVSLPYRGPYPSHARPYPEECEAVRDLLSNLHGHLPEYERHKVSCPTIEPSTLQIQEEDGSDSSPANSVTENSALQTTAIVAVEHTLKEIAVPTGHPRERRTVLDSLVGTLLSQNTTDNNSRRAFASLKRKFPTWQDVHEADPKDVEESIRCGGLAEIKAGRILNILNTLNQERGELCMQYLRSMPNEEIKTELSRFKGVGPKTVACVLMFHLQRNEFPVDTHVFRISKALGWVPASADREKAYLHLNERIPDHLKFDLHCLFVTHGKKCPYCAKRQTKKPKEVECPLVNWSSKVLKGRSRPSPLLLKGSQSISVESPSGLSTLIVAGMSFSEASADVS